MWTLLPEGRWALPYGRNVEVIFREDKPEAPGMEMTIRNQCSCEVSFPGRVV